MQLENVPSFKIVMFTTVIERQLSLYILMIFFKLETYCIAGETLMKINVGTLYSASTNIF